MSEKLLEEIAARLRAKTIHDLRQIARAAGVPQPAIGKKERTLDCILKIASGECDPIAPSTRGAHPKSADYDRQIVADILRCREISLSLNADQPEQEGLIMTVGSGAEYGQSEFTAVGILEKTDGRWFLRVNGCRENFISDIYVNEYYVNTFNLKEGDMVEGKCKRPSPDEIAGLIAVKSVNGGQPSEILRRTAFENLTPVYPEKRLRAEFNAQGLAGRMIDILSPVGAGQRAVITVPHGVGKTDFLIDVARGIQNNNPKVKLIILLIDAQPEEASCFERAFPDSDVFVSGFDTPAYLHVRTAKLALEYAKRCVEAKGDAVIILDGLTSLTNAYNSCGRQFSTSLETSASDSVKKFLSAARNTAEGGSLTIISSLNSDGDGIDGAIYSALKDLCNMRVTLSLQLARMRVQPPIEIDKTYTLRDEKLLSAEELEAALKLRKMTSEQIFKLFSQTDSNEQLCNRLKD